MARYFFDFYDGELRRDPHGTECRGRDHVREEAMHVLPLIAKENVPKKGDNQAYTVSVRNEQNITVYTATLTFAGIWLGEDVPPAEDPFE